MNKKRYLNQVSSTENCDVNGIWFEGLLKDIKKGRSDLVVGQMLTIRPSDVATTSYDEILKSAGRLNERIVFDDGHYLLTANEDIIVLYEYVNVKDRLGNYIEIGDKVIWACSDKNIRDLNRVWIVTEIQLDDVVKIEDELSVAKSIPYNLIKLDSLRLD